MFDSTFSDRKYFKNDALAWNSFRHSSNARAKLLKYACSTNWLGPCAFLQLLLLCQVQSAAHLWFFFLWARTNSINLATHTYQSYSVPTLPCCDIPYWFVGFFNSVLLKVWNDYDSLSLVSGLCSFTVFHDHGSYQLWGKQSLEGDAHWSVWMDFELIYLLICGTPEFLFELPDLS